MEEAEPEYVHGLGNMPNRLKALPAKFQASLLQVFFLVEYIPMRLQQIINLQMT